MCQFIEISNQMELNGEVSNVEKKEPFFPPPLGLFGSLDHIRPTQLNFAKQVIFAQISKNWLLLEISKSCHFKTVISYWIRRFLLISFQFWQEKPWFLSVRYNPAFVGQYGRKSKFQLKSLNIGLLASYETQNSKYY